LSKKVRALNPAHPLSSEALAALRIARSGTREIAARPRYWRYALQHFWNVFLLSVATAFALLKGSVGLLGAVMVAEVAVLAMLPRSSRFRQHVDLVAEEAARIPALRARTLLLAKMEMGHRRQLEHLEGLVERIRRSLYVRGPSVQESVLEPLGLDSLLQHFVNLAIAHKRIKDSIESLDRPILEHEIRALEAALASNPPATRRLIERRILIAKRRLARWERSREDLLAVAHQLAMVTELVQFIHEQCASRVEPFSGPEMDRLVRAIDELEGTLREIDEYAETSVEPKVLELGRRLELVRSD
jgi:hypothetical protein